MIPQSAHKMIDEEKIYWIVQCANCGVKHAFKEHYEAEQDCTKCGGLLGAFFIDGGESELIELPDGIVFESNFKDKLRKTE